jgi:hypothetical protein
MKCPCCNGVGEIEDAAPVHLSPMEHRIWNTVRRSKHGITITDLTAHVYADRPDGGPISARHCIWVLTHAANKRLAAAKQRITATKGHGSVYRLEHLTSPSST